MKTFIFISYGHDEYTEKVKVIMKSLNNRKEYQAWWDFYIEVSANWVREMEDKLNELVKNKPDSCFIYIVTPYSTSDERYNYCITEILKAVEGSVKILPIRLTSAPMPLPIGSVQWFDLTQCEIDINSKDFQQRLDEICKIIDSKEPVKIDGKQGLLHNLLHPCQFILDIDKHLYNFTSRQWLLDATVDWLKNRKERMLLIEGGPGTGKTAYSLWIATRQLPERIQAWHLCQYNHEETRSLMTCVKSLIWYLGTRLPYFYDSLDVNRIEEIVQGGEEKSGVLFRDVILRNLKESHTSKEKVVILIDALDEASENGVNKLAQILSQYVEYMPDWLKFIITTRNDMSVTMPLNAVSYVIDLDAQSNMNNCKADIRAYIETNIDKKIYDENPSLVETIIENSGNVILYAKLMCNAINKGEEINSQMLPNGLNSFFEDHIRRYFGAKTDFDTYALPIIYIMLASYQPIKRELIYQWIHMKEDWCKDRTRFRRILNKFGPLLKEGDEYILPFHKSLSDWFTNDNNMNFYVSREDGFEKMCEWGEYVLNDEFAAEELLIHFYTYQPQYLIDAKKYKEVLVIFSDPRFWERRIAVLDIDTVLQRMFLELSIMKNDVRKKIFQSNGLKEVLYNLSEELFNKGFFVQLKDLGYSINIADVKTDKDRITALKFFYINGDYVSITNNQGLFGESFYDKKDEAQAQNIMGLAMKKCGLVSCSESLFRKAIQICNDNHVSLDRIPFFYLNLSRVLILQCHFDAGRKELENSIKAYYSEEWRGKVESSKICFINRQLELAIKYVRLETELFSETMNNELCTEMLNWADELYSQKLRLDRYYPRHLQSKILYYLRIHRFEDVEPVMCELNKCINDAYDKKRYRYYLALYNYIMGYHKEGLLMVKELLAELKNEDTLHIEKTECFALVDVLEKQNHLSEISEELRPWYLHTVSLLKQICSV